MNHSKPTSQITYKDAGVDIHAGNELVTHIKKLAKTTSREGVLGGIGGFGALFELPLNRYKQPILVSSTDGVGTKLKLALALNKHDTIGIDLVAMCVNDIIVSGAEPLFFLDYFATGALDVTRGQTIISGIAEGCKQANAALIGGETAEMPGMYEGEDYDLAGFCVGIVEKDNIIDGKKIIPGTALIALGSSGPHSNGYSLIRKIIDINPVDLASSFGDTTLGEALLAPTIIYVKAVQSLMSTHPILGIAHITGGGILENLPRILPSSCQAIINQNSWEWPPIFKWLQTQGQIERQEMYRTFNCGVGMILCVPSENVADTLTHFTQLGQSAWLLGEIQARQDNQAQIIFI